MKKKKRVRTKIKGTKARPRLSVFRSNRAICAQIVDDEKGRTLMAASEGEVKLPPNRNSKSDRARETGRVLAKKAFKKGVKKVVFDRRHYKYHGRVRALAEGAREEGLEF